ncbi:sulfur oxidation c-type cytochrome SoxX [Polynucleobacter kasalickyi]|uniref:Monoheme cytochrome SoxX (Sulfur oxidation) n=1 Tax=Polynucleobacter kasalickyi TaxID=1938817 RepID=A0A1W1Y8D8_9BURK|nr:sulfur oxidation c-type cytochrome SoxX [Polynucleobacter kasalickyi]SMC32405.1 monoheme cytochrome SoxX (sulfur oxidation) [Polynucleobacter kasalickyi]
MNQILKISFALMVLIIGINPTIHAAEKADPKVVQMMQSSFVAAGVADLSRLTQDELQLLCSDEKYRDSKAGKAKAITLQTEALAKIPKPVDGVFLGDWKKGEQVAQSGRGATFTDGPNTVNGGGCYNCHQIDPKEISHGTMGPSLAAYGKTRGNSAPIVEYTWNRIYNSKSYNACSNMPRFGHFNLLTQEQMKDLMALLLDPNSPVNQ